MKTLKKILSVVLVVAMLASMLIVGAAAAETEKTNYEEAVAVVTGVGIIEGDENGMNFAGNVTREQAAKIISYLLLGEKTAEALKTTTAPFADVAATRWSAGYIAYLKGQGIISGVSDTEFDPTAPVTGIAFAKMLLTAVGYGANGEFEGKDWDINTITFANDNGVFAGTKAADVAAPATREEAMLYAFNVLTGVPVVKYNKTFESYYTGASALNPVTGTVNPSVFETEDGPTPYAYTLGYSKYALVKVVDDAVDAFGRPAASWSAIGGIIADTVSVMEPTAVFPGSINSATLYAVLGKAVVNNLNENKGNVTQYIDGDLQDASPITMDILPSEFMANTIGGKGAVVELYLTRDILSGDYFLRVVTYYEYFSEVQRTAVSGGIPTLKLIGETDVINGEEIDITGLAKGDYVIYTKGSEGIASVKAVAPVSATFLAYDEAFMTYVLDGVGYSASTMNDGVAATLGSNYGNTYDLYLDSQGNILYAEVTEEGEGAYQYVYIAGAEVQVVDTNSLIEAKPAKLVLYTLYPNGGMAVVDAAVKFDADYAETDGCGGYYFEVDKVDYLLGNTNKTAIANKATITSADSSETITLAGWYRFATTESGAYVLKTLNSNYANVQNVTLATGKAGTGTGYTANGATTLTLVDYLGNSVIYNGISNFVPVSGQSALITYGLNSKVAKNITIIVADIDADQVIGYCAGKVSTDDAGTVYKFYIDGVLQLITSEDTASTGIVYEVNVDDGVYTFDEIDGYALGTDDLDETADDKGIVNAGSFYHFGNGIPMNSSFTAPVTPVAGVGNAEVYWFDFATTYYEWATIDTVDDNFFTTVEVNVEGIDEAYAAYAAAVAAEETAKAAYDAAVAALEADEENETLIDAVAAAKADYDAAKAVTAAAKAPYDALATELADTVAGINAPAYTYYFDANTAVYDITGAGATTISEGDVFVAYVDETTTGAYAGEMYCSIIWIVG